jgi:hypothetical protein
MLSLTDMPGLWHRTLLVRADATRDITTWVAWLQGPTLFADLRQPAGRPSFVGVRALGGLSGEQVAWLAEQEGFAGRLEQDGEFFVWRRMLDFQPAASMPDSGRLYLDGPIMVEKGRHSPYVEHWQRQDVGSAPCAAAQLRDPVTGCKAILVRAGTAFMYARASASASLPAGARLSDGLAAAPSLAAARELVDCEISFGHVIGRNWQIERSSLPYREGAEVALQWTPGGQRCSTADIAADGGLARRNWEVVESEGDEAAFAVISAGETAMRPHA